jgi:cardiolipin synthase C
MMKSYLAFALAVLCLGQSLSPASAEEREWDATIEGRAQFLPRNEDSWFARYLLLRNAKESIVSTYFIIEDDIFGMAFLGLLRQKAEQGLKVQLLIDAKGTKNLARTGLGQDYLQELVAAGAEIRVFNPLLANGLHFNLEVANHDKILVVDHRYLVTGGRNLAAQYFLDYSDLKTAYFDRDVLTDSPEVALEAEKAVYREMLNNYSLALKADRFWNVRDRTDALDLAVAAMEARLAGAPLSAAMRKAYPELERYKSMSKLAEFESKRFLTAAGGAVSARLRLLDSTADIHDNGDFKVELEHADAAVLDERENAAKLSQITRALEEHIARSRAVTVFNPYVVLTPRMTEAFEDLTVKRKGQLTLVTNSPASTDSLLTQSFFNGEWRRIATIFPTIQIVAARGPGKLHGKVFTLDDDRAVIGSYNMDYISEMTNSEVALLVESREFADQVNGDIIEFIADEGQPYDRKKNLGAEQIEGSEDKIKRMEKFYGLASLLREFL